MQLYQNWYYISKSSHNFALTQVKISRMRPCSKTDHYFILAAKEDFFALKSNFWVTNLLKVIGWKE